MHDVKPSRRQALLQPLQDGLPSLLRQICMPSASRLRKEGCPGTGEQNLCCHVAGIFVGLLAQAPFVQYCFRIRTQVFAVQSTGMGMPSRTWIQKVQKRTCALNAHPFATSLCVSLHADSCILYGIMPHDILVSHQTCSSSHAGELIGQMKDSTCTIAACIPLANQPGLCIAAAFQDQCPSLQGHCGCDTAADILSHFFLV